MVFERFIKASLKEDPLFKKSFRALDQLAGAKCDHWRLPRADPAHQSPGIG